MPLTLAIAFTTLVFMYAVSIPVGIYSAVRPLFVRRLRVVDPRLSRPRHPEFPARARAHVSRASSYFGQSAGGLFSPEFANAPWSWAQVLGSARRISSIPVFVLGTAGTAFLIRAMRAAVLDELDKMYVLSAKASGLSPLQLLIRYPVRVALNPIASTLGWRLTYVISGAPIVGYVLALPDTGPLFLDALLNQDMQLAGRDDLHLLRAHHHRHASSPTCCSCCSIRASGSSEGGR